MSSNVIEKLIQSATEGDEVDLKAICKKLHIRVSLDETLSDQCKIGLDNKQRLNIWLNPTLDKKTKFTYVAIATAEYIIDPERVAEQGVSYDIFFLKDLNKNKATKLIILATRLAVPEHIIEHLANASDIQFTKNNAHDKFDYDGYIANANYSPEFLKCVIKESSSKFLLDTLTSTFD